MIFSADRLNSVSFPLGSTATTPAGTQHEMILVPAGAFIMGSEDGEPNEDPQHTVFLNAYYIDKYEVTVFQYRACVEAGACEPGWGTEEDDQPVTGVAWVDADAYCRWAELRLPTEAEWEKAARGTDGRSYPWGEEIDRNKANYAGDGLEQMPVGSYPEGASPYGCLDMPGNVWEWCSTKWRKSYDEEPDDSLEGDARRVVRGGSFYTSADGVRCSSRFRSYPDDRRAYWGFRCAQ